MHSLSSPETGPSSINNKGAGGEGCNASYDPGPWPVAHLLSNGRYHTMVTSAGGGYSRWKNNALMRWREDCTRDNWGVFFYIRDLITKALWSAAFQPVCNGAAHYQSSFVGGCATLYCDAFGLALRTDITVSIDDDLEIRKITITNHSGDHRLIDLTSYAEVALAPPATDDAHPAFNKLFIETEIVSERRALLCRKRPGGADPDEPWVFHMLIAGDVAVENVSCETDRARFIGRGNTAVNPQAMQTERLSGTQGSVLDPIVAIRCPVNLKPGQSTDIYYLFGAGDSRESCLALIEKYSERSVADDSFRSAHTHHQQLLNDLDIKPVDCGLYCLLADAILYNSPAWRADPATVMQNERGQSGLWRFSISGDLPIVLLQLDDPPDIDLLRQMLQAHAYWRSCGLAVDLVICNSLGMPAGQSAQERVLALVANENQSDQIDRPGGIFIRLDTALAREDRILLQTVARIVLDQSAGALPAQFAKRALPNTTAHLAAPSVMPPQHDPVAARGTTASSVCFHNGLGGFTPDGAAYVITLEPGQVTPTPWVNVLANPDFGTLVSESGCASTWSENAHEFLLTPWSNDPVGDSLGEAIYLRDEETGCFWSPTPWPCRGKGQYVCSHGFGYSMFDHEQDGIRSELRVYVAIDAAIKFIVLKLHNCSGRSRRLSTTGYVEWVLGDLREKTMMQVCTELDPSNGTITARNAYSMEFGAHVAFFTSNDANCSLTADRTEFIGRNGSPEAPTAMTRPELGGRAGGVLDPCGAIRIPFELGAGQEREIIFKLGAGQNQGEAQALIQRFEQPAAVHAALDQVTEYWRGTLGAVQVETRDKSLNFLANGWLVYQTIACRLWARTGFYQSSGAFGFRDQLQDVMALVHTQPGLVRAHILRCASRQYLEGDVQHWWHPPQGRGVRTRCSDDFLWLALAVSHYVATVGDTAVLDVDIPFLTGRPLKPGEESYYELPGQSAESATLYEHCVRAIRHGLRLGAHGLPLMGTGDWNDGMNKVGAQGKGESVWLAFFLNYVMDEYTPIAQARGDVAFARECEEQSALLRGNIQKHGWDGTWFRRAYFDNGAPLGSAQNTECQIDSIAQSWSVLSSAADSGHAHQAMQAVHTHLVDRSNALIKLLAPPFNTSVPDPGYIKAYVPGVRENGGQYTHAAVWVAMAFAQLHDREKAWELFSMLSPIHHGSTAESISRYKVEPYVVASDVYGLPPHTGRGGWTWYTGSSGWLYRLIVESILGLHRKANTLVIEPCVPADWEWFTINYRFGASNYKIYISLQQNQFVAKTHLSVDGIPQVSSLIRLIDDGLDHKVHVMIATQVDKAPISPEKPRTGRGHHG